MFFLETEKDDIKIFGFHFVFSALVVRHITWSCTEFGIALDDFVHGFQEIFFGGHLATGPNCEHASLRAHRPSQLQVNKIELIELIEK